MRIPTATAPFTSTLSTTVSNHRSIATEATGSFHFCDRFRRAITTTSSKTERLTSCSATDQDHCTGKCNRITRIKLLCKFYRISFDSIFHRIEGLKPSSRRTGFQRTRLLKPPTHLPPPPADVRPLIITHSKVVVPAEETTYWCRVTRLPRHFQQKHHVLQFEAAIQAGSESLVHHIELFHCEAPADEIIPQYEGSCSGKDRPEATRVCKRVIAAWAYGAGPFIYPEVCVLKFFSICCGDFPLKLLCCFCLDYQEAGLPIGGAEFNPFVMLEVHYNNPSLRGGKWFTLKKKKPQTAGQRFRMTRSCT